MADGGRTDLGTGDITIVHGTDPSWTPLEGSPGEIPAPAWEVPASTSADGRCETGLGRRAPETGAFERAYDEIAVLQDGVVDIEPRDAPPLRVGAGDVLVIPMGSSGLWRAHEAVREFWVVYHA